MDRLNVNCIETNRKREMCSFCLDVVELDDPEEGIIVGEESKPKLSTFSLCNVLHYLKNKLGSDATPTDKPFRSLEAKKVKLCQRCLVVASQVTDLCKELELIQMRVDHAVKEIARIIKPSQGPTRGYIGGMMLAREETRRLALTVINKSRQPQVQLEKVEIVTPDEPPIPDDEQPARQFHQCIYCNMWFTEARGVTLHVQQYHPEQSLVALRQPQVSEPIFESMCHDLLQRMSGTVLSNGFFKCTDCPVAFKNSKRRLVGHIIQCHYDKLAKTLSQLQNDMLGSSQSSIPVIAEVQKMPENNKMVQEMVRNLPKKIMVDPDNLSARSMLVCDLCPDGPKTCVVSTRRGLERHVFTRHPDYFFGFVKNNCSTRISDVQFKKYCNQILHQLQVQTLQKGISATGKKEYLVKLCGICQGSFEETRRLQRHLILNHFEIVCEKLESGLHESESDSVNLVKAKDGDADKHSSQLDVSVFDKVKPFESHVSFKHSMKRKSTKAKRKFVRPKCPYCDSDFSSQTNLRRHMTHYCANFKKLTGTNMESETRVEHKGIKNADDPSVSAPSQNKIQDYQKYVENKQFKHRRVKCPSCNLEITRTNLLRHMKNSCGKQTKNRAPKSSGAKGRSIKCPQCPGKFTELRFMKRHLRQVHNQEGIFEAVAEIQNGEALQNVTGLATDYPSGEKVNSIECQLDPEVVLKIEGSAVYCDTADEFGKNEIADDGQSDSEIHAAKVSYYEGNGLNFYSTNGNGTGYESEEEMIVPENDPLSELN